jgi:hypothetical protein
MLVWLRCTAVQVTTIYQPALLDKMLRLTSEGTSSVSLSKVLGVSSFASHLSIILAATKLKAQNDT